VSTPDPYAPPPYGNVPPVGPPNAYGPPPYGAPNPYQQQYGYPPPKPVDGFAVTSLVTGIMGIWPVGLICAVLGLRRTHPESAHRGHGLAVAGLVLSILWLLATAAGILAVVVFLNSDSGHTVRAVIAGHRTVVLDLTRGDCYESPTNPSYGLLTSVTAQDCSGRHDSQVILRQELPERDYPGQPALLALAASGCKAALGTVVAAHPNVHGLRSQLLVPGKGAWDAGIRTAVCGVRDPAGPRAGSLVTPG
jgi:Domain of unknown function (DUF4190)/Septum formation